MRRSSLTSGTQGKELVKQKQTKRRVINNGIELSSSQFLRLCQSTLPEFKKNWPVSVTILLVTIQS